jgi:hypothetical protein
MTRPLNPALPLAGLLLLAMLLAACGGESSRCRSHDACKDGLTCQAGRCTGEGIGAACAVDADCGEGLVCADHLPGGYCTAGCEAADDCPDGTVCMVQGGEGFCFAGCTENRHCRDGYTCTGGVCALPCESDAECAGGYVCQDQRCVGSDAGKTCGDDGDCGDDLECAHADQGGYCTSDCASDADCPVGSVCGNLLGERSCLARCRVDDDCGTDRLCDRGACHLPCTDDDECGEDGYCAPARVCRSTTEASTETIDLGQTAPGTLLDFEVDADVHSITLLVHGSEQTTFRFTRIVDPEGGERITGSVGGADGLTEPHRTMPRNEIISTQIPNSDDPTMGIIPGTWSFAFEGGTGHASVVLKRGGLDAGTVPLNVFVAPQAFGAGVDASNVGELPHFQAVLAEWDHFFRDQADVSLGEIRFYDVSAEYTDIEMDLFGGNMEYEEMFKRYGRDDGLNAFFVRSISMGGFGGVAGISGGIPGPPRIGETRHSGIVLEVQDQARFTGLTFCHEAGHFQGLFHTSEQAFFGSGMHDPLSDTPECSPGQDACTESKRHLMFPSLEPEMDTLSPASGTVVRANAGVD